MKKEWLTVIECTPLAKGIYKMVLQGTMTEEMESPGQFVHIKTSAGTDPLLRRPISICDIDHTNNCFTILFRAEGKGTTELAAKKKGEQVDVLGPLGNGFPIEEAEAGESVVLVGGGIGVPPLYYLGKKLKEKGLHITSVLGFQDKETVFYEEEFKEIGDVVVATADGSYGISGFVTDAIQEKGLSFDWMYSCGPTPMLKALEASYPEARGYVSLEERMGCGIGACFACVCHLQDDPEGTSYKKICSDGPVFPLRKVVLS
ncbi:dihydroorotate dehydrogenase electron transfer subunit [Thalassorhabdus alkalitolerans]|uniref:Dihydroorotate dehydrogenase B (NAD(+)), electron transfer subunit n=1 Tax=Thalassorhabdus alkalitolerans TaxID=2282697 RepID=A0ABW0YP11_9BACI